MNYLLSRSILAGIVSSAGLIASPVTADEPVEVLVVTAYQQPSRWLQTSGAISQKTPLNWQLPVDSAQLFDGLAGLQADSRSNYAQDTRLSIRGFGTRSAFGVRGLYLTLDGIPLTSPDGQSQLSALLLSQIGQVEVLRGPLASLYGNASGGVIQLFSRPIDESNWQISSSHASRHQQWDAVISADQGNHQWQLAAHRFTGSGFRPQSEAMKQQAYGLWLWQSPQQISSRMRLDWSYDPSLLDPQGLSPVDWQHNPRQTHPAALLFDTQKQSRQLQWSWQLSPEHANWQWSSWLTQREINQKLAFAGDAITASGGEVLLNRKTLGSEGWYRFVLRPELSLTLGTLMEQSIDRRFGFINQQGQRGELRRDEQGQVTRQDFYLRSQWDPSQRWHLTAGVRSSQVRFKVDDYFIVPGNPDDSGKKNFTEHAWALGSSFSLHPNINLFASLGEGFETPTLTEMAYQTEGTGLNLALEAARNQQIETGLKWLVSANSRFDLTLYRISSRNELVVDSAVGGRTSFRNAAETSRQGTELQWHWQPSAAWSHLLSANWLRGRYRGDELAGNALPGAARQFAYWQLQWQPWQDERLSTVLTSRYRSKVYADDANKVQAPSYLTVDLAVHNQQQWQSWQLQQWLELSNLTDRRYVGAVIVNQGNGRSFEPAAPHSFSLGLRLQRAF